MVNESLRGIQCKLGDVLQVNMSGYFAGKSQEVGVIQKKCLGCKRNDIVLRDNPRYFVLEDRQVKFCDTTR